MTPEEAQYAAETHLFLSRVLRETARLMCNEARNAFVVEFVEDVVEQQNRFLAFVLLEPIELRQTQGNNE